MKQLIIFSFLLLPMTVDGQVADIVIPWQKNDSLIYFAQATYDDGNHLVPKFSKNIPWSSGEMVPEVTVTVTASSPVDQVFLPQLARVQLDSVPALEFNLVYEKKRPVLQFKVTPFFVNSSSGQIEKVENFKLNIEDVKPIAALKSRKSGQFSTSSILASDNWYKIATGKSGIYKLTYEQMTSMGIGNPASVKIYGAGALLLPENYAEGSYDDLKQIPVHQEKGADQLFGPGDYILFYARGPVSWSFNMSNSLFEQKVHDFSDRGYYFVTEGPGSILNPSNEALSAETPSDIVTSYDIHQALEEEKHNLLNTGKEWYGDKYSITLQGAYPFSLEGLNTDEPVRLRVTVAGRSNEISTFTIKANNVTLGNIETPVVNMSNYTSTYAVEKNGFFSYTSSQEVVTVSVIYNQPNSNSTGWLNHITLNARGDLDLTGDELRFRDSRSSGSGKIAEFRLSGISSSTRIWDITDPNIPGNIAYSSSSNKAIFKLKTDKIREFIAFNINGNFPSPETTGDGLGKIENQNLHGEAPAEMIIVYNELFEEQAARLAAHRRDHDGLTVKIVTQETIFNEFSSGTPNVSALRNFLKMYYDRGDAKEMPKYLLLFGDGSFDNKDTSAYNPNMILTYQSDNSLTPTRSYVSDDYYGLLDSSEDLYSGLLDIGIGRLPVSTAEEAEDLTDKIIAYDQVETLGEWRNYICLIGDDEDGNIHMRQANSLAEYIEDEYPGYNINKVFMDAFPQETTPTGDLYPDVTRTLNEQLNRGALIVNYTGHGSPNGLAHEKILDITNIKAWDNEGKWPLFMTATCEFSRYDEYNQGTRQEITSAGEEVLLNPVGGSIALFTTTRLVYSGPNHVLNEKFYEIVFEKDGENNCYRLGDIIAYSKNNAGSGINKRNFTLLGDPAMTLSFPQNVVITDSINHVGIGDLTDTISALDLVTVSGHIEDQGGELIDAFNGTIYPVVYDKEKNLVTLANDGGNPMQFQARNSVLYKGKATVKNGLFTFSFYIPKDINYSYGPGKISYYSDNGIDDAHGATQDLVIGGLGDFQNADNTGPDIRIYMNDSLFREGGITTSSPDLLVYIEDNFGINMAGNGIGHDITATLDDDRYNAVILNEYFQSDIDRYTSGSVRYPYKNLETGKHTITVKVWDIYNNSSQKSLDFVVVETNRMLLSEIYSYPNPFIDQTWFSFEHNRPDQELEVVVRIYDINGNLVSILSDIIYSPGYRIDPLPWKGQTAGGATLGGGIYVYKVSVKSETGEEAVGSGRLIIKR